MKTHTFLAGVTFLIAFPVGLTAQSVGLRVGIAPSHRSDRTPYGVAAGAYPGAGHRADAFETFPGRRGTATRTAPHGSVVTPGMPAVRVNPGHAQSHPNPQLSVTVNNTGRHRARLGHTHRGLGTRQGAFRHPRQPFRDRRVGNIGVQQGNQIIQYGIGPAIVVNRPQDHRRAAVVVGDSRSAVLSRWGRPGVQILSRNSETMIFGTTTIIIQNGFVAVIR